MNASRFPGAPSLLWDVSFTPDDQAYKLYREAVQLILALDFIQVHGNDYHLAKRAAKLARRATRRELRRLAALS